MYLGHILDGHDLAIPHSRKSYFESMRPPTTKKELQGLLGVAFTYHYRKLSAAQPNNRKTSRFTRKNACKLEWACLLVWHHESRWAHNKYKYKICFYKQLTFWYIHKKLGSPLLDLSMSRAVSCLVGFSLYLIFSLTYLLFLVSSLTYWLWPLGDNY